MPQLTTLVLKDRASPAVDHSFTPRGIESGVAEVTESNGVPINSNRVTISLKRTAQGKFKPTLRYQFPVVQNLVINGITTPTVVRTAFCELNFSFDEMSTTEERNNAVGMVMDSLATTKTLINDTVVKLEGVY